MINRLFRRTYPFLTILLVSMWPLYQFLITGKSIFEGTSLQHMPPLKYNAVKTMLDGNLPLWNPHIFMGMPLLGDGISDPFDILNVVFIFFNPLVANIVLTVGQIFLSGAFMYLYLKKSVRLEKASCLLGGVLYTLNPAFLYVTGVGLDQLGGAGSIMWIPLIMLFLDKSLEGEKNTVAYALLTGITLAMTVFSGNPNLAFFIGCFVIVYVLCAPFPFMKKLVICFVVGSSSGLVSAVQILPTMSAAGLSHRTIVWPHMSVDDTAINLSSVLLSVFEFPVNRFLNVFKVPYMEIFIENYKTWYFGFFNIPFVLGAYFIRTKDYKINFNKLFIPMFLIVQIGFAYLPLRGFVITLFPFLKGMRVGHSSFLIYFSVIILIVRSFSYLLFQPRQKGDPVIKILTRITPVFSSIVALLLFIVCGVGAYNLVSDELLPWASALKRDYFYAFVCLSILSLSFFVLWRIIKRPEATKRMACLVLFLAIIANVAYEWAFSYGRTSSLSFKNHFKDSAEVRLLKSMKPYERMEVLYGGNSRYFLEHSRDQYFGYNLPLFYGGNIITGSHQMQTGRARVFLDMVNKRHPFDATFYWKDGKAIRSSSRASLEEQDINFNLVSLAGVRYFFAPEEVVHLNDFLRLKVKGDSYFIYENLRTFPRAFMTHSYAVLNEEQMLDELNAGNAQLLERVLLEEYPTGLDAQNIQPVGNSSAEFISYEPNEVVIETNSGQDGILVLTDAYDQGWKVYVDERKSKIYQADYLFRAVPVPSGKHIVKFKYLPLAFVYGGSISLTTLILCAVYLGCYRKSFFGKTDFIQKER